MTAFHSGLHHCVRMLEKILKRLSFVTSVRTPCIKSYIVRAQNMLAIPTCLSQQGLAMQARQCKQTRTAILSVQQIFMRAWVVKSKVSPWMSVGMLLVDTQMKILRRPASLPDFLHCQDSHLGDVVDALRSDWLLKVTYTEVCHACKAPPDCSQHKSMDSQLV